MSKYRLPYFQAGMRTADGRDVPVGVAGLLTPLDAAQEALIKKAGGQRVPQLPTPIGAGGRTFAAGDDGGAFQVTAACTLVFPENMGWTEGVSVKLPDTGAVSFIGDGSTLMNDATSASTRTKAVGMRVVAVTPAQPVNGVSAFDLSGS